MNSLSPGSGAIVHVRYFDGTALAGPATITFDGGRIVSVVADDSSGASPGDVPADAVDGSGLTLLPGLIDAHVHLDGKKNLEDAARWGITTMLDMGTPSPQLVASLRDLPGLTDIRSSESPASAPGGIQTTAMGFDPATAVAAPTDAEPFVAARVDEGADHIKIVLEDPAVMGAAALDVERASALVEAAHARDLLVYAHVTTVPAVRIAVDAGVDVLTHVPLDAVLDDGIVESIVADGQVAVPTLVMMRGAEKLANSRTHGNDADYRNSELSVAAMERSSVPILVGTDSNTAPGSPFQVAHGESLHDELELLVAAGIAAPDALRGATVMPSRHLGLADRGSIETGRRADLVLVEGDPIEDITVTRNIRGVWIGGVPVR